VSQENLLLTLHIICSGTSDIAFSLMWGSVLSLYWGELPDSLFAPLNRMFNATAIILCMVLPLQIVLLTADMAGTTHWPELRPILPDIVAMHAGSVLQSQFICSLLAAITIFFPLKPIARRSVLTVLLLSLTTFKSAAGHASIDGSFSVREISQWLHLSSIATWSGGVLIAAWILIPRVEESATSLSLFLKRLSLQCSLSVAIAFLSGLANSWLITEGKIEPLRSSTWGTLLLVKLVAVLIALSIGFLNYRDLRRTINGDTQLLVIKRIHLEAWIMIVILCASGWLSNLSPS